MSNKYSARDHFYHNVMLENDEAVVIYDCLVVAVWPVLSLPLLWIPVLLLSDN